MFALEWCEFCWAARRFLTDLGVPFRSVDLDSVAMQADDLATGVRQALRERTGEPTIPQIFIGGARVGGAVDLLSLHDRGELEPLLRAAGLAPTGDTAIVGRGYLPKWLAARPAA
ncbi:glutaredoxin family protein [Amaricoccus solimangrovi]|nr:glutaredoxin [Amaricoccus solimangrovi]